MHVVIVKTNIRTRKMVRSVKTMFNNHPEIKDWSIDLFDRDNVLRIEASENMQESDVIRMVSRRGYYCGELTDDI